MRSAGLDRGAGDDVQSVTERQVGRGRDRAGERGLLIGREVAQLRHETRDRRARAPGRLAQTLAFAGIVGAEQRDLHTAAAGAEAVDDAGERRLSGAGGAGDERGAGVRRQPFDGAEERLHHGRLAEQAVKHTPVVAGASERRLGIEDATGGGSSSGRAVASDIEGTIPPTRIGAAARNLNAPPAPGW